MFSLSSNLTLTKTQHILYPNPTLMKANSSAAFCFCSHDSVSALMIPAHSFSPRSSLSNTYPYWRRRISFVVPRIGAQVSTYPYLINSAIGSFYFSFLFSGIAKQKGEEPEKNKVFIQHHDLLDSQTIKIATIVPNPNCSEYESALSACGALKWVKQIHGHAVRSGVYQNAFVAAKLANSYGSHGATGEARLLFNTAVHKNAFLFNAIIRTHAWHGPHSEAFMIYRQMLSAGFWADNFTYSSLLKACSGISVTFHGKMIHSQILKSGFCDNFYVKTALLDMYGKSGAIKDARQVFDDIPDKDVVAWNAMIAGYAQVSMFNESLDVFRQMRRAGMEPNSVTMANVVPACAAFGGLLEGSSVHAFVAKNGFLDSIFVRNALVDMYSKCRSTELARGLFDEMPFRDVVSWNSMISGYVHNEQPNEALELFDFMLLVEGLTPNSVTLACVISACAQLGALDRGREIHQLAMDSNMTLDVCMMNALIDMYAKCGSLDVARLLFSQMPVRDVVSWNTMIAACGFHGNGPEALQLFGQLRKSGIQPNQITFVHVLFACSHAGFVEEGWKIFHGMSRENGIVPSVEHYACMVDLLGRSGYLHEAMDFVQKMPIRADAKIWGALLGACRTHQNIQLGELVAEQLFKLDPSYPGYYVVLSNMYAEAGRWDDVRKVRRMMKDMKLKKEIWLCHC